MMVMVQEPPKADLLEKEMAHLQAEFEHFMSLDEDDEAESEEIRE
jgi:hypothetical protein